ncbi:TonB family protein [Halomonas sp. GXIMD04776]|uniref:energy transducer TonB n=1 Tax=Halomonas sp. GXIMD04776 TaxID=3415605 RepID=UPI003CBD759C
MIRAPLSALGGAALALVLFWLLSLLVAPPEAPIEMKQETMPLSMVDAPQAPMPASNASAATESSSAPLPTPPAQIPPQLSKPVSAPEAAPVSAPEADSNMAVPEQESSKPETEPQPAPEPEPRPAPEPEPQSAPEPAPQPSQDASAGSFSGMAPDANQPQTSGGGNADSAPKDVGQASPISQVPPEYPARAQRRNLEGHVVMTFLIRPDGSVDRSSIKVTDARPRNVFERAARRAVAQWRFESTGELRRAQQRLEFRLR